MSLGPLMLDVAGHELSDDDRNRLAHPLVGGVILFARNYRDPAQLAALTAEIHALKSAPLLIGVDQEGGRVQRMRDGFTRLPAMRALGAAWRADRARALVLARDTGYVLGAELRACGVDFSFSPVLDLDYGASSVIGDRAFDARPETVAELAHELILGMHDAGMAAVGKHFPGHGYVSADSHVAIPVDEREFNDIALADLVPFARLATYGIAGMMPAHVIYPRVDARPAGFSSVWLRTLLRDEIRFDGAVFSDDLCMAAAGVAGDIRARVEAALEAGCDMALVCNRPDLADAVLATLTFDWSAASRARLARMHGRPHPLDRDALHREPRYLDALQSVAALTADPAAFELRPDPTDY